MKSKKYMVVDPRRDLLDESRSEYVCAYPDSRKGKWFNSPEVSNDEGKALLMNKRTAQRVSNLIPRSVVVETKCTEREPQR